ncbi:MAG: hypothetical protein HZA49_01600 [Planctomycetes bacterium]|nr:hypothetical protein [Planctomycetota bacterium]
MSNRYFGIVGLVLLVLLVSASGLYAQAPNFTAVALDEFGQPVDVLKANPGDVVYIEIQGVVSPVAYLWGAVMVEVSSARILSVEESYDYWHSGIGSWWTEAAADPTRGGAGYLYYYNHIHSEDNDVYKSEGSSFATAYAQNNPEPFLAGPSGSIYNPTDSTLPSSARFYYSGYLGDHSITRPGIRIGVRIQDTNQLAVRISNHTRFALEWTGFERTNEVAIPVAPRENYQSVHTEGNNVWVQVSGPASAKVGDTVAISTYGELLNDSGLYNASLERTESDGITSTLISAAAVAGNEWGPVSVSYPITHASEETLDGTTQDIGNIPELAPQRCGMTFPVIPEVVNLPPIISAEVIPSAPNANGWYNGPVTVIFRASDPGGAPLATPEIEIVVISEEGAGIQRSRRARDTLGLESEEVVVTVNIDWTPPAIDYVIAPGPNTNGWNNTDVTVTFNATDNLSGIDGEPTYTEVLSDEGAGQSTFWFFFDKAGNMALKETEQPINIDKIKPKITHEIAPNKNGWNNTDVTITFKATDNLSGIDGQATKVEVVSEEGRDIRKEWQVIDKAGNKSNYEVVKVSIDKTSPTLTVVRDPQPNAGIWYNNKIKTVTVTFTAEDPDPSSGIKLPVPNPLNKHYSTDGRYDPTCTAIDKAGNASGEATINVSIDKTPPEIDSGKGGFIVIYITGQNGETAPGSSLTAGLNSSITVRDNLSLVKSKEYILPATFTIGRQTSATVIATDNADNKTEKTINIRTYAKE